MATSRQKANGKSKQRESYIHDYKSAHARYIAERTAAAEAAFFLPYLRSGMTLLDCGCGVGTITIGLVEAVAPTKVVGIDIAESQIDTARSNAADRGISNLSFETENVYQLSYADNLFDAVFSNSLMEHLNDPVKAAKEMYRVLKPEGIVGIRSSDIAGALLSPSDPLLDKALDLYVKFRLHNGGKPYIARRQRAILREAGFKKTKATVSVLCWGTTEDTTSFVEVLVEEFAGPKIMEQLTQLGWTDKSHFEKTAEALIKWSEHADSFFALLFCEAVGWKT